MSADAWETCPICHNRLNEYPNGIEHLYGKIPLDDFLKLEDELNKLEDTATVRVDYEVYLSAEGFACVELHMKCQNCGAEWIFKKLDIQREGYEPYNLDEEQP